MKTFERDTIRVIIEDTVFVSIETVCNNKKIETGGIIMGYYTPDQSSAIIKNITEAPSDSKSNRTNFIRGVCGLSMLIKERWKNGEYYLGEWHFHPGSAPTPSFIDTHQMFEISKNARFKCPEPILLIAGETQGCLSCSVSVFKNSTHIVLCEVSASKD